MHQLCDICNNITKKVQNTENVKNVIINIISPRLLESIILFKKNWVFVAQIEVYYRNNKSFDESATATMMDKYPTSPICKIKTKTERGKSWNEVFIFWDRYEILITGGLSGCKALGNVVFFLGVNIPLKELIDKDPSTTEEIYVNRYKNGIKAYFQVRNLRNWMKSSSSYKWACISYCFYQKGFMTTNPLDISHNTPLCVLISTILCHIAHKKKYQAKD